MEGLSTGELICALILLPWNTIGVCRASFIDTGGLTKGVKLILKALARTNRGSGLPASLSLGDFLNGPRYGTL